jgi:hypothetical protein
MKSVVGAIDALADLIDWNSLELFNGVIGFLEPFLNVEETMLSSLFFYFSAIDKGMSSNDKI